MKKVLLPWGQISQNCTLSIEIIELQADMQFNGKSDSHYIQHTSRWLHCYIIDIFSCVYFLTQFAESPPTATRLLCVS